jgi:hypothetical protein
VLSQPQVEAIAAWLRFITVESPIQIAVTCPHLGNIPRPCWPARMLARSHDT